MERLTDYSTDECTYVIGVGDKTCEEFCKSIGNRCQNCYIEQAFRKLAEYERAEEQGLLVRLPCMEGMNLYQLCKDRIITSMVIKFIVVDGNCRIGIIDENGYERSYSENDIGKSVFLTSEEAEKKLEEMKNE